MKTSIVVISLMAAGVLAAPAQSSELDQLKSAMQAMQKSMEEMQQKIAELEKQRGMVAAPGTNVGEGVYFAMPTNPIIGHPSPVADRANMNDMQEAAPRLNDLTLDPKYRGFIPVPNTDALIKFNAKPRVDMMEDNQNSGNPDRFVTATIPMEHTPQYGGGEQFNMTAKGSSLSMDVRAPNMPGDFRFYYNNDFFGSGSGMSYRLKQLYGQIYNVTAGFTYSIFEDPDVWPDTVDFEGPNSMIFARQATVRYMLPLNDRWQINFGVQQPSSQVDTAGTPGTDASSVNHLPDGGFNVRWEDSKWGHVQFATILRDIGANSPTLGQQNVLGWGLNLSTSLNVFEHDSVQAQFTYGQGIFAFCNDNFTYTGFNGGDAAYNADGSLQSLTYLATMGGYTHQWSEKFRSTATFGFVDLQNEQAQTGAAYHKTYYSSGNLVWQLRKRLSVGLECLYGYKEENDGAHGDVWRVQTGMVYSLF
ncbi:MAG TPA: DcaP family trimeric outer membrane transporter [Candidatus Acidoferrum sp.]|nr:DcaP family trimeric outer membrane transporter [Candidatus Acidoferrum sp.]